MMDLAVNVVDLLINSINCLHILDHYCNITVYLLEKSDSNGYVHIKTTTGCPERVGTSFPPHAPAPSPEGDRSSWRYGILSIKLLVSE